MFSHGKHIAALQFFTDKIDDYWHINFPIISSKRLKNDKIIYPLDFSAKATTYRGRFNSDKVYLFYGYNRKYHLHALEIANYSLGAWCAYALTQEDKWKKSALINCDWLLKNQFSRGEWKISHKNSIYGNLPDKWTSSLAQGFAISSLIRAYRVTKNESYLIAATKAADYLNIDITKGGVKRIIGQNYILEEYPTPSLNGVLNGYITSVIALYELSSEDITYDLQFKDNLRNLERILNQFDTGFWSNYNLRGDISSGFYHRYIIKQLKVLYYLFPHKKVFEEYIIKFNSYTKRPDYCMKAFLIKTLKEIDRLNFIKSVKSK